LDSEVCGTQLKKDKNKLVTYSSEGSNIAVGYLVWLSNGGGWKECEKVPCEDFTAEEDTLAEYVMAKKLAKKEVA